MRLIGVTGGIGSGKSHVCSFLKDMGFPVYNSDEKAKELVYRQDIQEKIKMLLGEKAYINGSYNTKMIGSLVFNNADLLNELNKIIHPEVQKDFHIFVQVKTDEGATIIFKESALLIETKGFQKLDKTILVTAPKEVRKSRVLKREGMTETKFEAILSRQAEDSFKSGFCDFEISNDETKPFLSGLLKFLNELNTN